MENKHDKFAASPKDNEGQHNLTSLRVVVNGSETSVKVNLNAPLKVAVEKALQQTGNIGRPTEDWTLKQDNHVLELGKKVEQYNFPANAVLFLSLVAGQGGSRGK